MPDTKLKNLAAYIQENLPEAVSSHEVQTYTHGLSEISLIVAAEYIPEALRFLRDDPDCHFEVLVDITALDHPSRPEARFDVVYNLLSLQHNQRMRVKVPVAEDIPVPSVLSVYATAGWFEREIWDMFGIPFSKNPDLRRILTDYGFEGHPLRKDFPLTGHVELRWDDEVKRVVYEPVHLQQDFRVFDNLSPWEGMTDVMLPGDEKAVKPQNMGK